MTFSRSRLYFSNTVFQTADDVIALLRQIQLKSGTPLGHRLHNLFDAYETRLKKDGIYTKKINYIIVTDGEVCAHLLLPRSPSIL